MESVGSFHSNSARAFHQRLGWGLWSGEKKKKVMAIGEKVKRKDGAKDGADQMTGKEDRLFIVQNLEG